MRVVMSVSLKADGKVVSRVEMLVAPMAGTRAERRVASRVASRVAPMAEKKV